MTIETIDVDDLTIDQIDAAEVIVVSGTNLELRNTGSFVQWHQVGDVTWQNLIALPDISGTDGTDGTNGTDGASGRNGTDGVSGTSGWTPVFTAVTDSARRVLQVSDWTGGTGTKPTTGQYVGASGFTAVLASAVDIRGSAGTNGTNGASGTNGTNGASGAQGPAGLANETVYPSGGGTISAGTAQTLNLVNGGVQNFTLNASGCAFTLPTAVAGAQFTTNFTQGSSGGNLYSFVGTYKVSGAILPTLSIGTGKRDTLGYACSDPSLGWDIYVIGLDMR